MLKKLARLLSTKELLNITLLTFIPIFLVYLPFILKLDQFFFLKIQEPGFFNIIKNWDGVSYITVAKTFYNLDAVKQYLLSGLDPLYYTAHFPLYPLFIKLVSPIFGWLYSGLVLNLLFGLVLNILFYSQARKITKHAMLLTLIFTILPPRFFVTRVIIAPETLIVLLMFSSLLLWEKKKYFSSNVTAALSVLTKIQGLFLFPAYFAASIEKKFKGKFTITRDLFYIWLIPLSFVALSFLYLYRVGDFFAFFHAEQGNELAVAFPFAQFNFYNPWAKTAWLEDIVFYIIAMIVLVSSLYKGRKRSWFYFALFYTAFLIFIPQRDITRFAMPLAPIFFLQFHTFFTSKVFQRAFIFFLPALYFYVINFLLFNQAPVADWTPFLK